MKNIFLIVLISTTFKVVGQNHFVGLRGGITRTNITSNNFVSQHDSKKGITSGLTYEYLFKSHFSIGADLIYNQRGFTNDIVITGYLGNPTGEKYTAISKYDYISLPIKTGFNIGTKFYGFTNIAVIPSILMLASTTTPNTDSFGKLNGYESVDLTNSVSKFDLAGFAEIGCGYKYNNLIWFYTSFAYLNSFTTITNSDYFASSKIRHNGMTLTIGVKCALIKE